MDFQEEIEEANSTPPKLLLFSQRFNKLELEGGFTPPPHFKATVPFQWEEAPGKPRSTTTTTTTAASDPPPQKNRYVGTLNLPPRMFVDYSIATPRSQVEVESIWSPTSVLDGPYCGMRSLSSPKMMVGKSKWKMMMPLRKIMGKETSSFSSWRWDSLGDISTKGGGRRGGGDSSCSSFVDFSSSIDSKSKVNKVSKRRSLSLFNETALSILESMNLSINQAVPWRK